MAKYDADAVLKESAARKKRQDAEALQEIYARRAALARQYENAQRAMERRDQADREAQAERQARAQSRAEARQHAQVAWAEQRSQLQAEVEELRRRLATAKGNVLSESLDDARLGVADVAIYEYRLDAAERSLAAHARNQPVGW